jgi:hypothetical protein
MSVIAASCADLALLDREIIPLTALFEDRLRPNYVPARQGGTRIGVAAALTRERFFADNNARCRIPQEFLSW